MIGGQRGDAFPEALHLLDEARVRAGGEERADHGGVGERREGVPLQDPRAAGEIRTGQVDRRNAPDEVHRGHDHREARREPRVAPVALPREHVRDHLALDGGLEAAFQVVAGALRLEEVLLRLQPRLGDLLADLVQVLLGEVVQDARDVLHHLLAVREPLLGPGEGFPYLVAVGEGGLHVLLPAGRHVEELDAAVGRRGHLRVLARGGGAPLARDVVPDGRLRLAGLFRDAVLCVAKQVPAQRLDVLLRHLAREQRIGGPPLGVACSERIGAQLPALVEGADVGLQLRVDERHPGPPVSGRPS